MTPLRIQRCCRSLPGIEFRFEFRGQLSADGFHGVCGALGGIALKDRTLP